MIGEDDGWIYRFVTLPALSLDDALTCVLGDERGGARGEVICSILQ
jgi:hypothetical protein